MEVRDARCEGWANSATPGSGTVVNQVALAYSTFGQLSAEQQSHSGAIGSGTPSVHTVMTPALPGPTKSASIS